LVPNASPPEVKGNVTLVKGRFDQSLPVFLREHSEHVAFIHMDCDLYASARTVLDLIKDRLVPGTTIVLDDFLMEPGWQLQEHKAWMDFAQIKKSNSSISDTKPL